MELSTGGRPSESSDKARGVGRTKPSTYAGGGLHRNAFTKFSIVLMLVVTLLAPTDGIDIENPFDGIDIENPRTWTLKKKCQWRNGGTMPDWQKTCLYGNGASEYEQLLIDAIAENYETQKRIFFLDPLGIPKLNGITLLKALLTQTCGGDPKRDFLAGLGQRPTQAITLALEAIAYIIEGFFQTITLGQFIPKIGSFFQQLRARLKKFRDTVNDIKNETKEKCKDMSSVKEQLYEFLSLWSKIRFGLFVLDSLILPVISIHVCAALNANIESLVQPSGKCGSEENYRNSTSSGGNRRLFNRSLQASSCSLEKALEPVRKSKEVVSEATGLIDAVVNATTDIIDPLVPPLQVVVEKVADVLDMLDPVVAALEPFESFFKAVYDAFKNFDCTFCNFIADALNEVVEAVIDAFLGPFGLDMESLTKELLEKLNIPVPEIINFAAFDADFDSPLADLLAAIEVGLDEITGQVDWNKFDVSEQLNEALAGCTAGAWPVRVAISYDDKDLEVNCESYPNTRPVVYKAEYIRGPCTQDMTGFFRFPCDDNEDKSSCMISNYKENTRCPSDPGSYEDFPSLSSSTIFQLTYYCIDQGEQPEVLADLVVINTDALEDEINRDDPSTYGEENFPITGLRSRKLPYRTKQQIDCTGELRIDLDARSNRIRAGFGAYFDMPSNFVDTKYFQDLSYWDFVFYKENANGVPGLSGDFGNFPSSSVKDSVIGDVPSDSFKEWWTQRDAHDFKWAQQVSYRARCECNGGFLGFGCSISCSCTEDSFDSPDLLFICSVCPPATVAAGGCDEYFCPPEYDRDVCLENAGDPVQFSRFCFDGYSPYLDGFDSCPLTEQGLYTCNGYSQYSVVCPQSGPDYETRQEALAGRSRVYDLFQRGDSSNCTSRWDACNGAKSCNLVACELDYYWYACADFSSDVSSAEVIYHYVDTVSTPDGKTITCPSTPVQQELVILKAEFGDGFQITDVSELVQDQSCTRDTCSINAKLLDLPGKTLRVEYLCVCEAGFDVLPVDGTCNPCGAGKYREDSMPECMEVPPGYYSGGDPQARGQKYPCDIGYFTNTTGLTECLKCPEGYWSDLTAATTCKECGPGSANPDQGRTTSCDICGPGTQPSVTRGECIGCPFGTYGPGDGLCSPCAPGTYANTTGKEICDDVPEGSFQPQAGQGSYFIAAKGFYVDSGSRRILLTGATKPQKCPEGSTTPKLGATSASACIPITPLTCPATALWKQGSNTTENCDALVALLGIDITEKGNGFCQKCLNVEDCEWDGGDCCPETCTPVQFDLDEDGVLDEVLSGSCNPRNMECLTPSRDFSSYDCTNRLLSVNETAASDCDPNDPRVGNGFCDNDLNFEECDYDGGDCCLFSCQFPYSPFCARDQMNCTDPSGLIDAEKPRLIDLPSEQVAVCFLSDVPSMQNVTAVDNDPCFVEAPDVSQLSFANTPSNGQTTLKREWSVADLAKNTDTFVQAITYFEADIRLWDTAAIQAFIQTGCALRTTIAVDPERECFKINDDVTSIPIVLYGTEFLDVSIVDLGSFILNGLVAKPECELEDMNADGINDLVCEFVDYLEWGVLFQAGDPIVLSGTLSNGASFVGEDAEVCFDSPIDSTTDCDFGVFDVFGILCFAVSTMKAILCFLFGWLLVDFCA